MGKLKMVNGMSAKHFVFTQLLTQYLSVLVVSDVY